MMTEKRSFRRFTAEEDDLIRQDYAAFVLVQDTANKLDRSYGAVRQRILHLGLRRSNVITKRFSSAPEDLKALAGKIPTDEWRTKFLSWQSEQSRQAREQKLQARAQALQEIMAKGAEIDARRDLTRNEKIVARRAAGMTLQVIGEQYSMTRERVRQIVNREEQKMDEQTTLMEEKGKTEEVHEHPATQDQYTLYKGLLAPFAGEILDLHTQGRSLAQIVKALAGRVKEKNGMMLYPALVRYVLERYGVYKGPKLKARSNALRTVATINKNTATEAWELVAEMDGT